MTGRAGLVWDAPLLFSRYIEDCGIPCEHLSHHLLAAPHFRGRFSALIIPAGFGNPAFSRMLPALRASSSRIRRFVESGGNLLVYGPGISRPDAFDWLPFSVKYIHDPGPKRIEFDAGHPAALILADFDTARMECDGFFDLFEGTPVAFAEGRPVLVVRQAGHGCIVLTSIHEYPSRSFIVPFCSVLSETLL